MPADVIGAKPLIPLGQFRDTFIIAVDEEGIAIIDQHVAHERVLFERITERLTSGRLESQRLLEPLLIDLPPSGRQALVSHAASGLLTREFARMLVYTLPGTLRVRPTACPFTIVVDHPFCPVTTAT